MTPVPDRHEATSFLYPFIDAEEDDPERLVADLRLSAAAKMADHVALCRSALSTYAASLESLARAMAARLDAGGRLLAFGNGGSATDADGIVALFEDPPRGRPLPARSLVADTAVLSALANDVGYELVFSRQVIAHGRPPDIAVGFSTSGNSPNVLRGLEEAGRRGLLTVGFSGSGGGTMAEPGLLEHCLVVRSGSVHRIQEVQNALVLGLWSSLQRVVLAEDHGAGPGMGGGALQ